MSTAARPCAAEPWAPRALPARPGAPGEIHLWWLDLDAGQGEAPLSREERARAARFATPRLRARFTAAHADLRRILGAYLGAAPETLAFATGAFGKPRLAAAPFPIAFNLSHSGGVGLVAVAPDTVGVDVEAIAADPPWEIAPEVFTPAEWADITAQRGIPRSERFYEGWCRKEALAKAWGLGLSVPAADLPGFLPVTRWGGRRWHVATAPAIPGHAAAVACAAPRAIIAARLPAAMP